MSEQEIQNDNDLINEDDELENTLIQYANQLDDTSRSEFLEQLAHDTDFYMLMSKTLSETAMLFASAAVSDEDATFLKISRKIMSESRKDSPEATKMRLYYLTHREGVDLDTLLYTEEDKARFEARLESFLKDYEARVSGL